MQNEPADHSQLIEECQKSLFSLIPAILNSSKKEFQEKRPFFNHNLTPGQYQVMRSICRGRTSASEIAEDCHISPPAVSRQLESLVDSGLITRERDAHNRRKIILGLTDKGREIHKTLHSEISRVMSDHLKVLNQEELQTILDAIQLLRRAFELKEPPVDEIKDRPQEEIIYN